MLRQTYVSLQLRLKEGIPCQWNSPLSCRDQFVLLKSNGPNNPSLIFTSKKQTGGLLSSHIFGLFKSLTKIADLRSNLFHRKILAVTLWKATNSIWNILMSKSSPRINQASDCHFSATDLLDESGRLNQILSSTTGILLLHIPDRDFLFWEQSKDQVSVVASQWMTALLNEWLFHSTEWKRSPNKAGRLDNNSKILLNIN